LPVRSITVFGARATLLVGCAVGAVLLLGPFQGAERLIGLSDKEAHAIAFFCLTAAALLAAPRIRRNDLALVVIALGASSEVAQTLVGRNGGVDDLLADCVGVFAAWAPTYVEHFRRRLRRAARGEAVAHEFGRRRGDGQRQAAARVRSRPAP
jgi:VanZ family protein